MLCLKGTQSHGSLLKKSWFYHARVGLSRRYRARHLLRLCCAVCVILCLQLRISLYEYLYICASCRADGSGLDLVRSVTVLGQYSHHASLLVMVCACIGAFRHAPCLIGAAKQIHVEPSLTALPSPMQVQVRGEPGAGGPCSKGGGSVEQDREFGSPGRETTSRRILKDAKWCRIDISLGNCWPSFSRGRGNTRPSTCIALHTTLITCFHFHSLQ